MEALRINATKSLFSSDLTKEAKIENPNGQEDNDLDLDPKENIRIIMQQCL
jgi:predicted membrane chloride channel (bestrophin family)